MGIESRVGGEARRKDVIQKRHRGRGRVAQRAMFGAGSKMVGFLSLGHLDVAQLRVGVSMSLVPKGGGSVNAPGRDGGKARIRLLLSESRRGCISSQHLQVATTTTTTVATGSGDYEFLSLAAVEGKWVGR